MLLMFIEVSGLTKSYPVGGTRLTVLKQLDLPLDGSRPPRTAAKA